MISAEKTLRHGQGGGFLLRGQLKKKKDYE